jgi:hypothetical protein
MPRRGGPAPRGWWSSISTARAPTSTRSSPLRAARRASSRRRRPWATRADARHERGSAHSRSTATRSSPPRAGHGLRVSADRAGPFPGQPGPRARAAYGTRRWGSTTASTTSSPRSGADSSVPAIGGGAPPHVRVLREALVGARPVVHARNLLRRSRAGSASSRSTPRSSGRPRRHPSPARSLNIESRPVWKPMPPALFRVCRGSAAAWPKLFERGLCLPSGSPSPTASAPAWWRPSSTASRFVRARSRAHRLPGTPGAHRADRAVESRSPRRRAGLAALAVGSSAAPARPGRGAVCPGRAPAPPPPGGCPCGPSGHRGWSNPRHGRVRRRWTRCPGPTLRFRGTYRSRRTGAPWDDIRPSSARRSGPNVDRPAAASSRSRRAQRGDPAGNAGPVRPARVGVGISPATPRTCRRGPDPQDFCFDGLLLTTGAAGA